MPIAGALFAGVVAAIFGAWAWLGAAVEMPRSPFGPGEKLTCISYAPFRGTQSPFDPDIPLDPRQIEEDLAQLKPLSNCVRTYSIDHGLNQIPEIARRHGMKVLQGLWLSSLPEASRKQIDTAVALANRFPDVIEAVVVGSEVLLRGEMSAPDLARTIREVKAKVPMPVTYADVWEFWLRYREVAAAVDFVTIHILPYWEDFPIPVGAAAAHVEAIRKQVAAAFPDKEVLIGEFGWPSAGRMREGAPCRRPQTRRAPCTKRWRWPSASAIALMSSKPTTSPGSGSSKALSAGIGACSMPMRARPNSPGAAPSPTIRTGAGRRRAGPCWRPWCLQPPGSPRGDRRGRRRQACGL